MNGPEGSPGPVLRGFERVAEWLGRWCLRALTVGTVRHWE